METGLASDYTESIKQHKIKGQNLTMWEQFLTGTQEQYKQSVEQVTSAYETGVTEARQASAYDISQAYSNYKKQQLSLQMQEQLGAGFKQELGSELKSAYDMTYSGLEKQRESALSKLQSKYVSSLTELGEEYETAVKKGESEFAKLGEQAQAFDRLIHDFAETYTWTEKDEQGNDITKTLPAFEKGVHYTSDTNEKGEIVTELTDEGRLWYADIFNNENFQKWFLKGKGDLLDTELKNREEIYEAYRKNPDLFKQAIAGIGGDFDAEATRERLINERKQTTINTIMTNSTKFSEDYLKTLTQPELDVLQNKTMNNKNYVSTIKDVRSDRDIALRVEKWQPSLTDIKGDSYKKIKGYSHDLTHDTPKIWEITEAGDVMNKLSKGILSVGDIISYDNKEYLITYYGGPSIKGTPYKIDYVELKKE